VPRDPPHTNTPSDWEIVNGNAGVTVFREASAGVRGDECARIQSDGSSLTALAQNVTLEPNTVYAVGVWAKVSASDGTGVFRLSLTDENGNEVTTDAGGAIGRSLEMTAQVTTNWKFFSLYVATPRQLPVSYRLQFGYQVAPANGKSLYLDLAAAVVPVELYTGGPFAAAFAGADRTAVNDTWTVAVTNTLTSKSFARGMDRLYGMRQMGVYFPSAGSPTIPDSLVTH
jgi:hypothetical protein